MMKRGTAGTLLFTTAAPAGSRLSSIQCPWKASSGGFLPSMLLFSNAVHSSSVTLHFDHRRQVPLLVLEVRVEHGPQVGDRIAQRGCGVRLSGLGVAAGSLQRRSCLTDRVVLAVHRIDQLGGTGVVGPDDREQPGVLGGVVVVQELHQPHDVGAEGAQPVCREVLRPLQEQGRPVQVTAQRSVDDGVHPGVDGHGQTMQRPDLPTQDLWSRSAGLLPADDAQGCEQVLVQVEPHGVAGVEAQPVDPLPLARARPPERAVEP